MEKLDEYNQILSSEDGDAVEKQKEQEKINQHLKHQEKYQELEKQLEASIWNDKKTMGI